MSPRWNVLLMALLAGCVSVELSSQEVTEVTEVAATQLLEPLVEPLTPLLPGLPPVDHPRIDKALTYFQTTGRAWVELCLRRSLPYRDFIYREIDKRGMPRELFWLAAVESAFSPTATSKAGAVGLWQFMKNSISGYGMTVTTFADERRDFWKATEGALDKLKDNYGRLGDWYLALAAYNAGEGKIRAAIKKSGGIRDYWQLLDKGYLPRETAGYLPQLLALVRFTSRLTDSGLPLDWPPPRAWDRIMLDKSVDLKLLAEAAGVPWEALRDANRELNFTITPTLAGGYWLKVDPDWVEPLTAALADPGLKLMRFYLYSVQKGDTLSEIAQWYGASIPMIQRYNPGLKPETIKIAQNLVIPVLKDVGVFRKSARVGG